MENQANANSLGSALRLLMAAFAKERAMFRSGVLGIFLGIVGLIVMVIHGPIIEPEGLLKKAISFDIAMGVYVLTLLLFMPLARFSERGLRSWRGWHVGLVMFAYCLENIQIARGLDPRFTTHGSPLDQILGGVFFLEANGLVVLFIILAVKIFRNKTTANPLLLMAARYAFAVTLIAFAAGEWMSFAGGPGSGAAGNILALHAVAFHGLQAVPLLALFLSWAGESQKQGRRWVQIAGLMWFAACIVIGLQTYLGQSLFELSLLPLLTISFLLIWGFIAMRSSFLWLKMAPNVG